MCGFGIDLFMLKGSILIIAEKEYHDIYKKIFLDAEKVEFHTFEDAIEVIKNCDADIILIDSDFNVEKGLSLLIATKSLCLRIPVFLLANISSEDFVYRAFKSGARDFVKKPFSAYDLRGRIENILRLKKDVKESRSPYRIEEKESGFNFSGLSDKGTNIIQKIIEYIEGNISGEFNLEELAKKANMSRYHFCRYFTQHTGKSPMRFVKFIRVQKAKELLKKDKDIWTVAVETGFNSPSNFSKHFKRVTGMSPSAYKKSLKGDSFSEEE